MRNEIESFRKFVEYINNQDHSGGYWLPNIQRPFVWKEEQIERLFDSILREYPIGSLLIWKTKSSIKRRKFIDYYKKDLRLSDFYQNPNNSPKMLVLDGQQRLQSLFIGLKGSYENKELYIDLLSGDLVSPEDIRYKFKFLKKSDVKFPWFNFKDIVYSKNIPKLRREVNSEYAHKLNIEQKDKIEQLFEIIQRVFVTESNLVFQIIDSIDNEDLYSEDDVVEIFIRANSGGTPLGKSDLLFSLLTSTWDESEEKMEELLKELNKTGYNFTRDFILKTCLTIFKKGASYKVEKFRDSDVRKMIIDNWEKIANSIKDVKDYIYQKTFIKSDHTLNSYLVLIPLIYYRYHYYNKNHFKGNEIENYLIRSLMASTFSGNPDSLIDKCTKKIDTLKKFDVNEIFGVIRAEGRNLEISKDKLLEFSYSSKEIHLIFNLWYNFNYKPSFEQNKPQIDHIFPQSELKKIKINNPETGRKDLSKYKTFERDQLANCMLLTASENGSGEKGDKLPKVWFANKSKEYLDLHSIPTDKKLWEIENYEQFIEERKRLIIIKFKEFIITNKKIK